MNTCGVCSECILCILDKYLEKYPADTPEEIKMKYLKAVLSTVSELDGSISAPEAVAIITKLQKDILGIEDNFTEVKKHFNKLMLGLYPQLQGMTESSEDPFYTAVCFALTGNYIDFGAIKNIDENKLIEMLRNSEKLNFSRPEFENLKNEVLTSAKMVYLTDNCGEIVTDKLLISVMRQMNPNLQINVIVRGAPVLNDATMEDAVCVGLDEVADVISNGTPIAGTCLSKIASEAKSLINNADFIISKGQGNFETLLGCGKNVYYLFLCKCNLFAKRFGVEKFTEMLINEKRK